MWQMFTDLNKKKQGTAVYQAMTRTASKANSEIQEEGLGKDDGLSKIIQKLDSWQLKTQEHTFHLRDFIILRDVLDNIL